MAISSDALTSSSRVSSRCELSEHFALAAEPNCKQRHYYMLNNRQPGLLAERCTGGRNHPSAANRPDDRRCPDEKKISWHITAVRKMTLWFSRMRRFGNRQAQAWARRSHRPAHALGCLLPDLQSVPVCQVDHGRSCGSDAHIKDTADLSRPSRTTLCLRCRSQPDVSSTVIRRARSRSARSLSADVLGALDDNPKLKAETAVLVTFGEGRWLLDSGFVSARLLRRWPRIPLLFSRLIRPAERSITVWRHVSI